MMLNKIRSLLFLSGVSSAAATGMAVAAALDHAMFSPHHDFFFTGSSISMAFETALAIALLGTSVLSGVIAVGMILHSVFVKPGQDRLSDIARRIEEVMTQ